MAIGPDYAAAKANNSRVSTQILIDGFTKSVGRPPVQAELNEMVQAFSSSKKINQGTIDHVIGVVSGRASDTDNQIRQIYQSSTGRAPTTEEFTQLQQQFSPQGGSGTFRTENLRGFIEGNLIRDRETTQKAEYEKLLGEQRTREDQQLAAQKRLDEERQGQLRQEQELERLSGSIGGVSPSELAQLRAALSPTPGTVTPALPPEQIVQNILGQRKSDLDQQSQGFSTLRDSLRQKFDTSRTNLATAQEEALGKYGTLASNVQSKVLDRLLPQIQAQLAARGLETGGGAFQAQTAKLATDLATETEGNIANQRLALDTERANLARGDDQALTDLELQQSEILRQKGEADRLAREGRLDQLTLQRLQQNIDEFNRRANLTGQREQSATGFQQQVQGVGQQQNFASLQNAFNQREQQLSRDLQSRQFEQQMAFQQQQFAAQQAAANKKPSLGSSIAKTVVPLAGAAIGAYAGGPAGASAGYNIGSSFSSNYGSQPLSLRSQFQSPTSSFIYGGN